MERRSFSSACTIGELLFEATKSLAPSDSSRLDSELLLAHVLGVERTGLLIRLREDCSDAEKTIFAELVDRRRLGEPVAYILGCKEFYGLSFEVTPDVLIPRPETELLVEEAVGMLREKQSVSILDLGTGSGCISISVAHKLLARGIDVELVAVDISEKALEVARRNAEKHRVAHVITFKVSDWYSSLDSTKQRFDCIIANPPYVDRQETLSPELAFEPSTALFSLDEGLSDATRIIDGAQDFLLDDGVLLCEVGAYKYSRMQILMDSFKEHYAVSHLGDGNDLERFLVVKMIKR